MVESRIGVMCAPTWPRGRTFPPPLSRPRSRSETIGDCVDLLHRAAACSVDRKVRHARHQRPCDTVCQIGHSRRPGARTTRGKSRRAWLSALRIRSGVASRSTLIPSDAPSGETKQQFGTLAALGRKVMESTMKRHHIPLALPLGAALAACSGEDPPWADEPLDPEPIDSPPRSSPAASSPTRSGLTTSRTSRSTSTRTRSCSWAATPTLGRLPACRCSSSTTSGPTSPSSFPTAAAGRLFVGEELVQQSVDGITPEALTERVLLLVQVLLGGA